MKLGRIAVADTDQELARCVAVMHELRTQLSGEQITERIALQRRDHGYRLAYAEADGEVQAVAGFRITRMLHWGLALYVDDLVAREASRGQGFGSQLFDWLVAEARRAGCAQLHLDSGVQRFAAHRFYLHKGMDITSHHFALDLSRPPQK